MTTFEDAKCLRCSSISKSTEDKHKHKLRTSIYSKMCGENRLRSGALEIGCFTRTVLPLTLFVQELLVNNGMIGVLHNPHSPDSTL